MFNNDVNLLNKNSLDKKELKIINYLRYQIHIYKDLIAEKTNSQHSKINNNNNNNIYNNNSFNFSNQKDLTNLKSTINNINLNNINNNKHKSINIDLNNTNNNINNNNNSFKFLRKKRLKKSKKLYWNDRRGNPINKILNIITNKEKINEDNKKEIDLILKDCADKEYTSQIIENCNEKSNQNLLIYNDNINDNYKSNNIEITATNNCSNKELFTFNNPIESYSNKVGNDNYNKNEKTTINQNIKLCCTCKHSYCLKLYCECFKNLSYCKDCNCSNCYNIPKYKDIRYRSIIHLKKKNKFTFKRNIAKDKTNKQNIVNIKGCKCYSSKCNKKYCECFLNNINCSTSCKCKNCLNKKDIFLKKSVFLIEKLKKCVVIKK